MQSPFKLKCCASGSRSKIKQCYKMGNMDKIAVGRWRVIEGTSELSKILLRNMQHAWLR